MKRFYLFFILLLLILAACGPAAPEATNVPAGEPALEPVEDVFPRVTITPTAVKDINLATPRAPETAPDDGSYPAPPTVTPYPEGYPSPPPLAPTRDPYPAAEGSIWILRPVGIQCESPSDYPDIQAAVADLTAIGVEVNAQETIELVVTTVCGSPTSAHFRVQIDASDLANAELLGWELDERE
ncbi:MAG: hypothetical protein HF973_13070 [Chloroflexi bacterium]|nr:hypothetical protein [Chloroflexota bacterium]